VTWYKSSDDADTTTVDLHVLLEAATSSYYNHTNWFLKHRDTTLKQLSMLLTAELLIGKFLTNSNIPMWLIAIIYLFLAFLSLLLAVAGAKSCQRSFLASLENIAYRNKLLWAINSSGKISISRSYNKERIPVRDDETVHIPRHLEELANFATTQDFIDYQLGINTPIYNRPKNTYYWATVTIWSMGLMGIFIGLICTVAILG